VAELLVLGAAAGAKGVFAGIFVAVKKLISFRCYWLATLSLSFMLLLAGCVEETSVRTPSISRTGHTPSGPGIYYWKTTWQLSPTEQQRMYDAGTRQLLLRLFDVDWNFNTNTAQPRGELRLPDALALHPELQITPVVYFVERIFRQDVDTEDLARRVGRSIRSYGQFLQPTRWQIDCDWTPKSRQRYFAFLTALQVQNPEIPLSVTVRLHQYRERTENGVPPVPEGLLMCYNMEPVGKVNTTNAIYREDLLRGYLRTSPYPLPLDAALPAFSWGAAFHDVHFLGITPPPDQLGSLVKATENGHYFVLRDTTLGDAFVRAGDDIRYDGIRTTTELVAAAELLRDRPEIRDLHFFDWQPAMMARNDLKAVWNQFYGWE